MKASFWIFSIVLSLYLIGCSKDNNEPEPTKEEKALAHQEEVYQAVKANIVGHWKGAQAFYKADEFHPRDIWEDITNTNRWHHEYIFNADGTGKDIYAQDLIYGCTYTIFKNKDYIKYPEYYCEVLLVITDDNGVVDDKAVWMDGEYLRIYTSVRGEKRDEYDGGGATIRYQKE